MVVLHQLSQGYRCGTCGDPWDGVRENEAGGRFATGQISRAYRQGAHINVTIQLTANHKGFFEFKLCPVNDASVKATQVCLDQHVLSLADGSGTRYGITTAMGSRDMTVALVLPADVTCTQCVLQWRYHAGNSWGTNADDGVSCVGCGPQEEFYGCADIQIVPPGEPVPTTILDGPNESGSQGTSATSQQSWQSQSGNNAAAETGNSGNTAGASGNGVSSVAVSRTTGQLAVGSGSGGSPVTVSGGGNSGTVSSGGNTSGPTSVNGDNMVCQGVRNSLDTWCQLNCQRGYCPASHCSCTPGQYTHANPQPTTGCRGAGIYADLPGYNAWCRSNCAQHYCPSSLCVCT
ncbi:cell wall integrity and stress response component 4-like [Elysia marginata]|uniref:Cell wall integrity and stress response component 4-like n=1 Tax=Elysia marginata TaxID=1093978 RepID=A0AAV4G359_9GAST|nr:cell wall integrity and stress response component 4-like [Elysia marginata]